MQPYDFVPAALVKEDLAVGTGASAEAGDDVLVHYIGWIADGLRQFDSSRARRDPLDFSLGGKRRLVIPPQATLVFEVELLEVS